MRIKDVDINNFDDFLYFIKITYKRAKMRFRYYIYSNISYKTHYLYLTIIFCIFCIIVLFYFVYNLFFIPNSSF